jgi:hypothetical protein
VRSRQLQAALTAFAEDVANCLQAALRAGEEVPFELAAQSSRQGRKAAPLYSYRPLTSSFIAERYRELARLPTHAHAVTLLAQLDGLDRYLLARSGEDRRTRGQAGADAGLLAFLQDLFEEQTDFQLHPERLERALGCLDASALAHPAQVTLLATLHGIAIVSPELHLTSELLLAQPQALDGLPEQALGALAEPPAAPTSGSHRIAQSPVAPNEGRAPSRACPLFVLFKAEDGDPRSALARGRGALLELLRALRLFGDGRIAIGCIAHARIGSGPWTQLVLDSAGGHPHGLLLVTPEQEDELRAFCSLTACRASHAGPTAWALRRFELGCERASEYEALSDHLLALRALLGEAEGGGVPDGLLAGRLAAICATPEQRSQLSQRTLAALSLERACVTGAAVQHAGGLELARELADHLRALLRDQICGHLPEDLVALAEELLLSEARPEQGLSEGPEQGLSEGPEQVLDDEPQALEVLDLAV